MIATILIIDDEKSILDSLSAILEDENYTVYPRLRFSTKDITSQVDLVLLDVRLQDQNGLEVLKTIKSINSTLPIIMISGHGTIDITVEALKSGAQDFLEKPLSLERVITSIANCLIIKDLSKQISISKAREISQDRFVSSSQNLISVLENLHDFAYSAKPILITGPTGSGKSLLSKNIFHQTSDSKSKLKVFSCRTMNEADYTELFSEKDNASLFSDNSNTLVLFEDVEFIPLSITKKVVSYLESQHLSQLSSPVTFIATSCLSVASLLDTNLYNHFIHKISELVIRLPALSERPQDVKTLFDYYADFFAEKLNRAPLSLDEEALVYLETYPWPGNVRELKNLIENTTLISEGINISRETLTSLMTFLDSPWHAPEKFISLKQAVRHFERNFVLYVIKKNNGNITRTALELKVERTHLYRKLHQLGIKSSKE